MSRPFGLAATLAALVVLGLPAPAASRDLRGTYCERSSTQAAKRRYVVAAIGDSLTDQRVGGGRYMKYLQKSCPGSRFDAYGVGGQQTSHMRWRFLQDVFGVGLRGASKPKYTHVIVLGGVNDLTAGSLGDTRIGRIRSNLSWMYEAAGRRGVEVVAVTVPPWGRLRGVHDLRHEATDALNAWILGRERSGAVAHAIDVRRPLECGPAGVLCPIYRMLPNDEIHWSPQGHEVVADTLRESVFADCE